MRLLLLFLAACGSSSTFATASPLETTETDESDLASARIAPGAPDAAAGTGCYCPEVTVRCAAGEGAYHARADRASCTLDLPPKACALFGLSTGSKAFPERLLATKAPTDLSADDVYELCSVKHEAQHACDRRLDSPCMSEVEAYDVSLECMLPFATDEKVSHNIEGVRAAREMNACLCAETACGACTARCKSEHPAFATTCDQAEAVYCQ